MIPSLRRTLILFLLGPLLGPAPAAPLPRSTPETQGVSSADLLRFVQQAEQSINSLHSLMIVRRGHVIAEGWWAPYAAHEPHSMFSLSKSFTSTAVGFAIADGRLSVDDPVLGFFPDEAPATPDANLKAMRVRDLLTMSTGHHAEAIRGFSYQEKESAVKRFLALPVAHKPGTLFVYNTPATYMLSAIVQKVTGQTVLDYLRPRLFEPLGVEKPSWDTCRDGVSLGGIGLSIRTEDIAKFGLLYLKGGKWQGRQVLPAGWVETAIRRWMSNGSNPESDWEQGYGFQFWRCRHGAVRGDGASGQFCIMLPELDAVVAFTAGTRDLQGVLNVVWAHLLPVLRDATAAGRPADAAAVAALETMLRGLALKTPPPAMASPFAAKLAGRRFSFPKNALGLEALSLQAAAGDPSATQLALTIDGDELQATVRGGRWEKVERRESAKAVALSGAWTGPATFTLDTMLFRTPAGLRQVLKFSDDAQTVTIETRPQVGMPVPVITGRAESR